MQLVNDKTVVLFESSPPLSPAVASVPGQNVIVCSMMQQGTRMAHLAFCREWAAVRDRLLEELC